MAADRTGQRAVDEVDIMLLDAMHANPRISFERLGPALGISPATAARRWQRLADTGRAWISSVPGPELALVGAVYEVRAQPGRIPEVAAGLAAIPQVASVYATDGDDDLHALVFAESMPALTDLLLQRLPCVPGIARARSHIALDWYSGVRWHLGAIDTAQQQSVADPDDTTAHRRPARTRPFTPEDQALFLALQHDGRARYRDLARTLDTSEHLVRRHLDALVRRGMLSFRTDFTRPEAGWPTEYILWLAAPPEDLATIGRELSTWPETRICLSVVGRANLLLMTQTHHPTHLHPLLTRLATSHPEAAVLDHRLILRPIKSWGRLLDRSGQATAVVPVNPWAATTTDE